MCGAVGRSGLPMPRSITSWPAARARAFMAFTSANTYGGRRFSRWNSESSICRFLVRLEIDEDFGATVGGDTAGGVGAVGRLAVGSRFNDDGAPRHAIAHQLVGDGERTQLRYFAVAALDDVIGGAV